MHLPTRAAINKSTTSCFVSNEPISSMWFGWLEMRGGDGLHFYYRNQYVKLGVAKLFDALKSSWKKTPESLFQWCTLECIRYDTPTKNNHDLSCVGISMTITSSTLAIWCTCECVKPSVALVSAWKAARGIWDVVKAFVWIFKLLEKPLSIVFETTNWIFALHIIFNHIFP